MQAVLDEVIEKVAQFSDEERDKLFQFLLETKHKSQTNGGKGFVHPNTLWIKEHHAEYAEKHVALKDGELIAFGNTIKEADLEAKGKGVEKYMLTYLFPLDSDPFGGW